MRRRTYRLAEELLDEFAGFDLTQGTPESLRTWEFVADLSALQSQLAGGMYWRRGTIYESARAEIVGEVTRVHRLALDQERPGTAAKLLQIRNLFRGQ